MKLLLDTHAFLWWNLDSPELSQTARDLIAGGQVEVYVSAASAWEIAIKAHKGRLKLPAEPDIYVADRIGHYRFLPLPVDIRHASRTFHLPDYHADLFDRLLVAQCQVEDMALLSADAVLSRYDLKVIW